MVPVIETERDKRQRERVERSKAQRGSGQPDAAKAAQAKPQRPARKGDRWAAFNSFIDLIAPRLTLAERAVWLLMFRHARDGVCETTVRNIARAAAVSRSTAEAALQRLAASGLVWAIWKSPDRSKASKYGIHGHPDRCLHRLPTKDEPSRSSGRLAK